MGAFNSRAGGRVKTRGEGIHRSRKRRNILQSWGSRLGFRRYRPGKKRNLVIYLTIQEVSHNLSLLRY